MLLKLDHESSFELIPFAPNGAHCFESDTNGSVYGWDWSSSSRDATWPALLNTTMRWASDCRNTVDKVYASEFCAIGTKATDACHISKGSPVVLKAWGQDILVGMVSYNPGSGKSDTPTSSLALLKAKNGSQRPWPNIKYCNIRSAARK